MEETEQIKVAVKKKGGWFQKIPSHVLFSPGGMILLFFALIMEVIDWIPIPVIDQLWELPLEIIFIVFFFAIVKDISWKALVIPFIVERIPIINDIIPSFLLKMFM